MEELFDLGPEAIRNIEEKLKLTYVPEKEEIGNVCMANNAEVRNEYKAVFDAKDLLDYRYAALHSPGYYEVYNDLSKIAFLQVPYPDDQNRFWELVALGAQLRQLHLSETKTATKYSNQTDKILKKIAKIEIDENP